jgi:hypothetical protein
LTVLATVAEREDLPVSSHHPLIHSKRTVQSQCASIRLILSSCPPYNTPSKPHPGIPSIIHPLQTAPRYPFNHTPPPLCNPQQHVPAIQSPLNLLQPLDPQLAHAQDRILMLTPHRLHPPIPPLRLHLAPHRLSLGTQDPSPALEDPLIHPRRALERVVARAEERRAVQPQHVPRHHARHVEREPHGVADGRQVRLPVDVGADVVRGLHGEEGQ